ncbi:MAG: Cas10/Cmr2 second palm domain-containing protein [Bryobacteraceae bacterium]
MQGRIFGFDDFAAGAGPSESELTGRAHWAVLLSEVLPRALIAELGLSKMLLGSSGSEQFLVVLPGEVRPETEEFLNSARRAIGRMSGGQLDLLWAITENLGDWTVVRKRLNEQMQRKKATPLARIGLAGTGPNLDGNNTESDSEYFRELAALTRDATTLGWSPEAPARITAGAGKHNWNLGSGPGGAPESIPFARHTALSDDGHRLAPLPVLASRAEGAKVWGVLRGDVDDFGIRIRRLPSIEEHVQLSVLYKQFFAGELEVLCSMGEFWRKVTLVYAGGDDFAVYGAWDSLIAFGRELQRVFQRFAEDHLKDFPGPEGKTITMALALAPEPDTDLASVYERAGQKLQLAKSIDKDCFHLLGRTLEWKQLSDAAEVKQDLASMVKEHGIRPDYIRELCGIYRETKRAALPGEKSSRRTERPWRFHCRLNRILGSSRSRDFQKARNSLVAGLAGRNPAHLKLRPSGRVALEWARLSTEQAESE